MLNTPGFGAGTMPGATPGVPTTPSPSGRRMATARSMASPGGPGQPHRCGHARLTQRHEAVVATAEAIRVQVDGVPRQRAA